MNVPAQPLPTVLPRELDLLVKEIAQTTQAPYELIVSVLLSATALSVQHRCRVQRKPGLDGPIGLFLITICDSGERKSAVQKLLFKAFMEIQRRWGDEAMQAVAKYKIDRALWREKKEALSNALQRAISKGAQVGDVEKQLRELLETEPQPSFARKLIYADTTIEALLAGLSECGNSAALVHDEFAQFCDGPMARQLGALNALWSGLDWPVDRKTSGSFVLHDASLTCLLQAQPTVFQRFFSRHGVQALGNGFFARVLLCSPISTQGHRFENGHTADNTHINWFYDRCKELLEKSEPRVLRFSTQAQWLWNDIANSYESSTLPGGSYHGAKDFASKAAENIARIAAVFHAFLNEETDEISSETLQYAANLVDYYGGQFLQLLGRTDPVTEQQYDLAELERWIRSTLYEKRWNYVPKTHILQYGPNRLRNKAKLDLLIEILVINRKITIWKINKKIVITANATPMVAVPFNPNY